MDVYSLLEISVPLVSKLYNNSKSIEKLCLISESDSDYWLPTSDSGEL